jgi:hypothetical protein
LDDCEFCLCSGSSIGFTLVNGIVGTISMNGVKMENEEIVFSLLPSHLSFFLLLQLSLSLISV